MCCARGCGKCNFLLNTQYLKSGFKELFAQDIYLDDIRGRIFFIINNHSRENCTWEEKVAHQQLTYQLHRQNLACKSSCINGPRQDFGKKSIPNPKQAAIVIKHINLIKWTLQLNTMQTRKMVKSNFWKGKWKHWINVVSWFEYSIIYTFVIESLRKGNSQELLTAVFNWKEVIAAI